jgi:hypothetical protein
VTEAPPVVTPAPKKRQAPRTAILVVNGFSRYGPAAEFNKQEAREFPWIKLCLDQIAKHTHPGGYRVFVWDNAFLPEHTEIMNAAKRVTVHNRRLRRVMRHGPALNQLLKRVPKETEYVVTLDTDSFPVRDGWLPNLIGRLDEGAMLAGAWRDEMGEVIEPYVHPSCFAARRNTLEELGARFTIDEGKDVAHNITLAVQARGGKISRLRRSNVRNGHFLIGGLYGDLVYHQGAGSRNARFYTSTDLMGDEATRIVFRDAVFHDLPATIDYLAGDTTPEDATAAGLGPLVDLVEHGKLSEPPGSVADTRAEPSP